MYEGNLLLVDERNRIYTCLYLRQGEGGNFFLLKGADVPVYQTENHKFSLLYFGREEVSELLYELYYGKQGTIPSRISCIRTPLLAVDLWPTEETALSLIIDFGSSNTTMGRYDNDGSVRIVRVADTEGEQYRESEMIPSVIGIAGVEDNGPVYRFGYAARHLAALAYHDEDCPVFYDLWRDSAGGRGGESGRKPSLPDGYRATGWKSMWPMRAMRYTPPFPAPSPAAVFPTDNS